MQVDGKVHIRSHQHHQHLISCNMVTSALQDVPDVACILTASMVATWRKWDALRKSPWKIPSRVIQWLTPLENFHGWVFPKWRWTEDSVFLFNYVIFSFQPFIFQGLCFQYVSICLGNFLAAGLGSHVRRRTAVLRCTIAVFSILVKTQGSCTVCLLSMKEDNGFCGCLSKNPSVLRMRGDKEKLQKCTQREETSRRTKTLKCLECQHSKKKELQTASCTDSLLQLMVEILQLQEGMQVIG